MHLPSIALAFMAVLGPLATAHSESIPHIVGLDFADARAQNLIRDLRARLAVTGHAHEVNMEARDSPPECGEGIGSCPAGKCCSRSGYCGTTDAYCYSPGCKYQYGPGCPENNPPAGTNTSSTPRPKFGSVAYGGDGIFRCVTPGTVALTFDDGPQTKFTDHILDVFKSYNAKATFFMTGNNINKGQIDIKHANVIKRVDAEGHQIASHTWTHLDLSEISSIDRKNQIWMNEMAIRNVVRKIPTYLRPPYSSCTKDSGCQQDLADLGYHIVNFNVDTDDYNQITPENIQKSKDWFKGNITKDGASAEKGDKWLSIGHDILDQTANNLTEFMLSTLTGLGYKAVTVGDCLGDPKDNWYRQADGAGVSVANNTQSANSTSTTGSTGGSSSGSPSSGGSNGASSSSPSAPASTGAASSCWALSLQRTYFSQRI
ncbi:glycoside hydrolase/deacetylase [Setomelanomma holmii]|uniref:Glycoside hydrolase/deacetylase n=1 Tax=Setomelanomma holmii TaxID=210430 RepID=A0A9P4GVM3_9PLEO|nr:glycoside hydrolase/deacetylase [Setomelanomma holmii]